MSGFVVALGWGIFAVVGVVASCWIIYLGFKESTLWGLVCLFVPLGKFLFAITHWDDTKKPFLIQIGMVVAALLFLSVSTTLSRLYAGPAPTAIQTASAGDRSTLPAPASSGTGTLPSPHASMPSSTLSTPSQVPIPGNMVMEYRQANGTKVRKETTTYGDGRIEIIETCTPPTGVASRTVTLRQADGTSRTWTEPSTPP